MSSEEEKMSSEEFETYPRPYAFADEHNCSLARTGEIIRLLDYYANTVNSSLNEINLWSEVVSYNISVCCVGQQRVSLWRWTRINSWAHQTAIQFNHYSYGKCCSNHALTCDICHYHWVYLYQVDGDWVCPTCCIRNAFCECPSCDTWYSNHTYLFPCQEAGCDEILCDNCMYENCLCREHYIEQGYASPDFDVSIGNFDFDFE